MQILLVKTSALGDVVHNLPAVTDIARHVPGAVVDWAVEPSLADLPALHPAVRAVIPVPVRNWRRRFLLPDTWGEVRATRQRFHATGYDVVIDTQGLIKSAVVASIAPGLRAGLDWRSAREPLRPFYDRTYSVAWGQHAVERNRALCAMVLGYKLDTPAAYGIVAPTRDACGGSAWSEALREGSYAVLLHATSAKAKLWPEQHWISLAAHLTERGLACVLPWGNDAERIRTERLAKAMRRAVIPPRMTLRCAAWLLGHAVVVVGVDTGLTHLAAALGTATIGIYVSTDARATGLYAGARIRNTGSSIGGPSVDEVLRAAETLVPMEPAT